MRPLHNGVSLATVSMMTISLKRGLDLPIAGVPEQRIRPAPPLGRVALVGADYPFARPRLAVAEGERVALGQTLFTDQKHPQIHFTASAAGRIAAIERGARRKLASVVIQIEGEDAVEFPAHDPARLSSLAPEVIRDALLRSGLWPSFRSRPHNGIPPPDARPRALFVTAMDTNPLAPDPRVVIGEHPDDFRHGLIAVSRLAAQATYVCKSPSLSLQPPPVDGLEVVEFEGPHPAGLPGTHIHYLGSAFPEAEKWHVSYQDVIAIGRLLVSGQLSPERVIALGGPAIHEPCLARVPLGAHLGELLAGNLQSGARIISGSVLAGRRAALPDAYLGRYHHQLTALPEHDPRSASRRTLSGALRAWALARRYAPASPLTTAANGGPAGMLVVEAFEDVWPLRMPPAPLLRALLVRDTETAQALGCLDLDEEDLALCSYVCPAKHDYGAALRATLREIERLG